MWCLGIGTKQVTAGVVLKWLRVLVVVGLLNPGVHIMVPAVTQHETCQPSFCSLNETLHQGSKAKLMRYD